MKTIVNISLLLSFLVAGPAVAVYMLLRPTRDVTVQIRREHGAVILNNKKVRVPYTMQETAVPTHTDDIVDFLFLDNQQLCFVTALIELTMGLLLVLLYHVNTVESKLRYYRPMILKALLLSLVAVVASEFICHYVHNSWLIDVKNGINGKFDLFGVNATFPNPNEPEMNFDYQITGYIITIPLIVLYVIVRNRRDREELSQD